MADLELSELARQVGAALKGRRWVLATAESCTGGWVAEVVTSVSGSSEWFDRGFVTYSNEAKEQLLDVSRGTLDRYGAVSEEAVRQMAQGALLHSHAQVAVAVSGIAGPTGGSAEKPVGTVWFGWATEHKVRTLRVLFTGDRESVRRQAVVAAMQGILAVLGE